MTSKAHTADDVLCVKGISLHVGNLRFHALIRKHCDEYAVSGSKVALKVVRAIRDKHGRFLKKDSESNFLWFDIGDEGAVEMACGHFEYLTALDGK